MLLMLGDLHYSGHYRLTTDQFNFAVHEVFKSNEMRQLYSSIPMRYMLEYHDIGANNANGNHKSLSHAVKGY